MKILPDDDINISVDQSKRLKNAIRAVCLIAQ